MTPALAAEHFGLVERHARLFLYRPDIDDIFAAGRVGVIKAARKFDGRGKFSTYANFWIRREILQYINRQAEMIRGSIRAAGTDRPDVYSLDVDLERHDGETGSAMIDSLPDPHTPLADYIGEDLVEEVRRIINKADDIPDAQKTAVISAISGGESTNKRAEALCRFRQCTSKTSRKVKELLHA